MAQKYSPTLSILSVFRNRSFALLWTSQLISATGSALTLLASVVLVFRIKGTASSVGLMLIATAGPTILIGLFAGILVDRYDRKWIMFIADIVRAILIFIIPFLISFDIIWLYIIVALSSVIAQFFDSAHASLLPEVTSGEELSAANAMMAISSVGSTTLGFAMAGFIVWKLPIEWAFYLDTLSFFASAALVLIIRIAPLPVDRDTSIQAVVQNLRSGLRVVNKTAVLRSLFIIVIPIFLLFGLQNSLLLPFTRRALGASEFDYGLQLAAESIGIAVGSLIMVRLSDRIREGQWLAISYIGMAISTVFYSLTHSTELAILLIGISGLINAPSLIGRQLVIQRNTPREVRGRVNSAFFVVRDVMFMAGMGLAGLADIIDVRHVFLISSLALLVVGAVVLIMPGLGQPTREWKRTMSLLRGIQAAPRLGHSRAATVADFDRLSTRIPELAQLSLKKREELASLTLVSDASPGAVVVYRGEKSDSAYFILSGKVAVGYLKGEEYIILEYLEAGDFFGEVAALIGSARIANVIVEEPSMFLVIPANIMRQLEKDYASLQLLFIKTMVERLRNFELPVSKLDQWDLRDLRTNPSKPAN
jgi:CRP-like cAMP-binding protein/predicted MFS family arabinose efflux permease